MGEGGLQQTLNMLGHLAQLWGLVFLKGAQPQQRHGGVAVPGPAPFCGGWRWDAMWRDWGFVLGNLTGLGWSVGRGVT